jgi:peptidoglycan/xylan/chitin deacetylase (PgdA/CDA1 family)
MVVRFFFSLVPLVFFQCNPRPKTDTAQHMAKHMPVPKRLDPEVPILCYHNIKSSIDHHAPLLTVTDSVFHIQIKMLYDSGYHAILPDQLYKYLTKGSVLPPKPILITFDDSHEEHYSVAAKELEKYGFRGVFFVMTVAIDKPHYLTHQEIKALADEGHTVASHTYDHPMLTKLPEDQWSKQIERPRELLEKITGRPIDYFAYPYGGWNQRAVEEVKKQGFKAAFQLSDNQSKTDPLFTIRRIMVSNMWTTAKLSEEIHSAFNKNLLAYSAKRSTKML